MSLDESNSNNSGHELSHQQPTVQSAPRKYLKDDKSSSENVIKAQINSIYDAEDKKDAEQKIQDSIANLVNLNPYKREHQDHTEPQPEEWKKYHSAWQEYYQKYYEGYYNYHLENIKKQAAVNKAGSETPIAEQPRSYFTKKTISEIEEQAKEEEIFNLRQNLITKAHQSVKSIRHSRHFVPIISGIIVVMAFLFLQFNRVLISNISAYVTPGEIDPQNIVIDPATDVVVGPESKLIIPKINVNVPVMYDVGSDYASQMSAMEKGVAHFSIPGASSHPGEIGNTAIAGHSSNDLFDTGDYKFIFAQLDKLEKDDLVYANYKSKRYTYIVTKKEIVKPDNVSALTYSASKPILTLITCTPLGTSQNRLLVTAEQISPDPDAATKASEPVTNESNEMPSSSPTFLERLFGG